MNALLLLVATASVGVDVGWQPLTDGGVEYIIQIEPQWLNEFATGHDLTSQLPAGLDVRRFRITVGTAKLPQIAPPPVARPNADRTSNARRNQPSGPPPKAVAGGGGPQGGLNGIGPGSVPPAGSVPFAGDAPLTPIAAGSNPSLSGGAAMGTPQALAQPIAQPPVAQYAPPPIGADAPPAVANEAANVVGGPALGPPAGPALASPAAIADRVSQALDDPNAPGRTLAAETPQPKLPADALIVGQGPPRTLEPDPSSEQLAEYKATPHEAQRQNERGAGGEQGVEMLPGNERLPGERQAGEHLASQQFNAAESPSHGTRGLAGGAARSTSEEPADRPWPMLIGVVVMLLFSISANVYLAWVAWDFRMRYRELLAEHGSLPVEV